MRATFKRYPRKALDVAYITILSIPRIVIFVVLPCFINTRDNCAWAPAHALDSFSEAVGTDSHILISPFTPMPVSHAYPHAATSSRALSATELFASLIYLPIVALERATNIVRKASARILPARKTIKCAAAPCRRSIDATHQSCQAE